MKIVFLSGLYPPHTKGGGEISTYLIAEGLKARGHEVEVITEQNSHLGLLEKPLFERRQSRKIAKKLTGLLHPRGVENDSSGVAERGSEPATTPGESASLTHAGELARQEVVIYHAHDFRSALALSELGLSNSVVTVRDYAPTCGTTNNILADGSRCHCTWYDVTRTKRFQEVDFPRNYARAWQYWHNVSYRKEAFQKIKHQIFISRAQQHEIGESLDLSGVHKTVIYNPVSEEYLAASPYEGRGGSVLYVGRLEDYKGVQLLLTAWQEVVKQVPHAHLMLVGEGAQKSEYEAWVARNGLQYWVTFKGRVPYERLQSVYDEAQIIVVPHIWTEPFGRTVAEAMARGKIIVAANSGGPGEIIQNGRTGILFESGSAEKLGEALRRVLAFRPYDLTEIGNAARVWVGETLTVERIARQYEDFYQTILS